MERPAAVWLAFEKHRELIKSEPTDNADFVEINLMVSNAIKLTSYFQKKCKKHLTKAKICGKALKTRLIFGGAQMKNTGGALKERLLSMIGAMGEHPERYAKNPGKDFTRQRSLTLPTLISLILTMDEKSMWKGLLGNFQNGIDTPSASAFVQQRKNCCLRRLRTCSTVLPTP